MQQKNNYVLLTLKQNPFFQAYFFFFFKGILLLKHQLFYKHSNHIAVEFIVFC